MQGSTFGKAFCIHTFGESHGGAVGVVIEGCPAGVPICIENIQYELNRRKPGQNILTTPRQEPDLVHILSGIEQGISLGTPILLLVYNQDAKPQDYAHLAEVFRPSHADFTYFKKYGIKSSSGGGRASARETLARVAAGSVAKQILKYYTNVEILAYVSQIWKIQSQIEPQKVQVQDIEQSIVRCPDKKASAEMQQAILEAKTQGDSLGGIITGVVRNAPIGLGEPVFDKISADLAKAMLSINAAKGFEYGSGFDSVFYKGSQLNDAFYTDEQGQIHTQTNHSGGIQGGITNGEPIIFRVAFKPTATILKSQKTVNMQGEVVEIQAKGRHDPCVLPRAVPIVEAMTALVLIDHYLRNRIVRL
ncbi:MAG: chorismate synthase [Bacteroidia bacterium]|nr:chorismate synthase [Bacteroidia bacterium]MDW8346709.1 chorismate synthase [Bacteroidia bacterium]